MVKVTNLSSGQGPAPGSAQKTRGLFRGKLGVIEFG